MKKLYIFFLLMISLSVLCNAQDLKTNVDYQYKRMGDTYSAYTAYLNNEENTISLAIVSNYNLTELLALKIKVGKRELNIPFAKIDVNLTNDDKKLNSVAVKLDFIKILKERIDCETTVIFYLTDGNKIELPFMYCLLKGSLKI